jgi:signal transduction histidine kinase
MEIIKKNKSAEEYEKLIKEMRELQATFLDNMSHELRTPITVILGYAGILADELEDPDLKEMAEIVLKSSNRLTESLNLLLDQSAIQSNSLQVEFEEADLSQIIENSTKVYKPVAEDKSLKLQFINNCSNSVMCRIDRKMLNKVMDNLLSNAIKYTKAGNITVKLEPYNEAGKDYAKIEVSDTGIGIEENKLSLVFEAFRQVSEGMNRLYQGTGLGLSVTKKFVELMNGKITVSSKLNEGTTFTILFPAYNQNGLSTN